MPKTQNQTYQESEGSDSSIKSDSSQKRKREKSEKSPEEIRKRSKNTLLKKSVNFKVTAMTPLPLTNDQKLELLITQMNQVITNTNTTNETLQTLIDDVKVIKEKQHVADKRLRKMEKKIGTMHDDVEKLKIENNKLQQNSLSRDFVIFGLPNIDKKEMPDFVAALSNASNFAISYNDLENIYPVPMKSDRKKCIIYGKFYSEKMKTDFLKACRQKKPFPVENIAKLNSNDPMRGKEVFVRSQLTSTNRLLAAESRKQRSLGKLQYAWERDGRILIRKNDTTPIIELQSLNQLMAIISPNQIPNNESNQEDRSEEEDDEMQS